MLYGNGKAVTSDMVETYIRQNHYRHAFLEELLALGAAFPDLQMNFPIVALGSVSELLECPELYRNFKDEATSFGPESLERALLVTKSQGWLGDGFWERPHRFAIVSL